MSKENISIDIPTYKEVLNVRPLTERIDKEMKSAGFPNFEIVLVDDNSNDGTEERVAELQKEGFPIRVVVRRNERGLSSAVVKGFTEAKYDIFVVMDADLQHDPKFIPSIIKPIIDGKADFVMGSRNVGGGKVEDWPLVRRIISWGATSLAKPLTTSTDPMSGFFSLHRKTFNQGKGLNPMGYKIGLELIVRCNCKKVAEVPITFRDREHGESKLTMKQNLLYLRQLLGLYVTAKPLYVVVFLAIFFAALYFAYSLACCILS